MPLSSLDFALEPSWASAWFWLLWLIALVWLRRHFDLNRARHTPVLCSADAEGGSEPLPKLSVLVAAKDEEANIRQCLDGLLAQDYPQLEIIAIDDRSSDRTGAIIAEIAAREPRVRAEHVRELPAGWGGKSHAMHVGVQHANGDLLCFTDADCRYLSSKLLRAAAALSRREQIEFLSVLPDLEAQSFWERVVQPPAGAIMVFWFPPEKVNDPGSSRAYANGAFMLLTRGAYDRLGGHEQVRSAINEDMHLARRAKRLGLRLHVIRGGGMYSVRMYHGPRQIWNGWTRIFYGSFGTWPRLIASTLFLAVFSLLPWVSVIAAPFAGMHGRWLALAAGAAILAQHTVLRRFYRLCSMAPGLAWTYPLGAGLCLAMMCNAMTRLVGVRTEWRGTSYAGGA